MNPNDTPPDRQNWSSAMAEGLRPAEIGTFTTPLIRQSDMVGLAGTMLAARIGSDLGKRFAVLRGERLHPVLADIPPETEEYEAFSAGYGELRSARELLQLVRRSARKFAPKEDRRHNDDIVVDLFRPGLRYAARSDHEFDLLLDRHINAVRSAFRRCSVLIVSLGAAEVCESTVDGAVFPAPPSSSAADYDPEQYVFRTLSVDETIADLEAVVAELRSINPAMRVILMVSPEPLSATASTTHVLAASTYGKAILRVAMEQAAQLPGVAYFPAMEILAAFGADAFDQSGRALTSEAIETVISALLAACEGGEIILELVKDSPEAFAAFVPALTVEEAKEAAKAERREKRAAEQQKDSAADQALATKEPDAEFSKLVRVRERKERKAKRALAAETPAEPTAVSVEKPAKSKRKRREKRAEHADAIEPAAAPDQPVKPKRERRGRPQGTLAERIAEKQRRALEEKSKR